MKHSKALRITLAMLAVVVLAGCGGPEAATLTPDQEAAARHPVADRTYTGPSKEGLEKMNQSIAEYQKKHENDKLEYNTK